MKDLGTVAKVLWSYISESGVMNHAAWSPDGRFLALTQFPEVVIILDGETGGVVRELQDLDGGPGHLVWAPDGHALGVCTSPGSGLSLYDSETWASYLKIGLPLGNRSVRAGAEGLATLPI
jgi:hypothetical protein